jgi:hypothetical protein
MSPAQHLGGVLVVAGLLLVLIGFALWSGALGWFGHLPGDIRVERDGFRLYLPVASMLLVSAALSLLLYLLRRLL